MTANTPLAASAGVRTAVDPSIADRSLRLPDKGHRMLRLAGRLLHRAQAATATTPGRLRLYSIAIVGTLAVLALVSVSTIAGRIRTLDTIRNDAGPSIVTAQRAHAALSEADATAAASFLAGGAEPADQLAAYNTSITAATDAVASLTRLNTQAAAAEPLAVLAEKIPVYTGLIERAHANNRVGNVVGAAYLRQGSQLVQETILPATDRLITLNADSLDKAYADATSGPREILLSAVFILAAGGLVGTQIMLYRRTNRVLNIPLVTATFAVLFSLCWTAAAFSVQQQRLSAAHDSGFVPMTLLAQSKVLALRARVDENQSLIARGNGTRFDTDFTVAVTRLGFAVNGGPLAGGSLSAALRVDGPDTATRTGLDADLRVWLAAHQQVTALLADTGDFTAAGKISLGAGTAAFDTFDQKVDAAVTASQARFSRQVSDAGEPLSVLLAVAVVTMVAAAGLSLAGMQRRIDEYR
ncbi:MULTISPECIES: hypothetical protein [unclassified Frankia]|uniref:hypothetical protein n=1 Tax=unclassified Frankia TaxID=2632575 RepID=UPI002AD2BA52|nr:MULTISPECIES: hypothetical protein [unclassified Frankia]